MTLLYNLKNLVLVTIVLLMVQPLTAQDGKAIFKAKCAACHNMKQKLVGPALKGIVKKWEDAGEGDLLDDWIRDPKTLKESGKSKMAIEAWEFSPVDMIPFLDMSEEDMTALITYMKDWTPPAKKKKAAVGVGGDDQGGSSVTVLEDNNGNSLVFIILSLILLITLASFVVLGKLIKQVATKSILNNKAGMVMLLIGGGVLFPTKSHALSLDFSADSWLTVTTSDIYMMMGIILVLLLLLMYLKTILNRLVKVAYTNASEITEDTVMHSLTQAVAIEDEDSILMDHEYDGIQELDNVLPPWWLWGFYFTVIFAFVYMFHYHVFKTGDLQAVEYEKEMMIAQAEVDAYNEKHGMTVDLSSLVVMTDEKDIKAGEEIFKKKGNCFTCHLADGSGQIGPNLTDDHWLYEKDIKSMYSLIVDGTDKGMPPMGGASLNPIQVQQVSSYILQLDFVKGKAPEGEKR